MATISRGGILQVKVTDPGRALLSGNSNVTGARYLGKPEIIATPTYTETRYDKTGSGAIFEIDANNDDTFKNTGTVSSGNSFSAGDVIFFAFKAASATTSQADHYMHIALNFTAS